MHVLQTFHGNHAIRHARSVAPGDPSAWTWTDLADTSRATYGAAYRAENGDFYHFFRHRDNAGGESDYEPEYYLKSTNDGATWTRQIVIDPIIDHPAGNDGWGTVYTKSMHYRQSPSEGIDIVFGIHKLHNLILDKHYYVFFSFADDNLYAADGTNLGVTIDRTEFESCCLLFEHGAETPFYNVRTAVDVDSAGNPAVFHNQRQTGTDQLRLRRWTGSAWSHLNIGFVNVEPYEVEVGTSLSDAVLYGIESRRRLKRYTFESNALAGEEVLYEIPSGPYRLQHLTFFAKARPAMKGFLYHGLFSHWASPNPSGQLIPLTDGCIVAGRAILSAKSMDDPAKDRLTIRLLKGAMPIGAAGDPVVDTDYVLSLTGSLGGVYEKTLPSDASRWKPKGSGFNYRNKSKPSDIGVKRITVREETVPGKENGKVIWLGLGAAAGLPSMDTFSGDLGLRLTNTAGTCVKATIPAASLRFKQLSKGQRLKGKTP